MKESSSEPTKDDGSCAEPRLMPTLVAPGGLIVCLEVPGVTHLGHFSDVAVLDGTLDSQLVTGDEVAVRVRSSAVFFACKTCKNEKHTMFVSRALSAVDSIPKPRPRHWRATSGCSVQQVA
jgi:hypothetical protein